MEKKDILHIQQNLEEEVRIIPNHGNIMEKIYIYKEEKMYQFVVDFIGEVPENFTFIYVILTGILGIAIIGSFTSVFYFVLKLIRGVN